MANVRSFVLWVILYLIFVTVVRVLHKFFLVHLEVGNMVEAIFILGIIFGVAFHGLLKD